MNIELLLKVKEQILREPAQFVMGSWFRSYFAGDMAYDRDLYRKGIIYLTPLRE